MSQLLILHCNWMLFKIKLKTMFLQCQFVFQNIPFELEIELKYQDPGELSRGLCLNKAFPCGAKVAYEVTF